jgi:hypothetical protein
MTNVTSSHLHRIFPLSYKKGIFFRLFLCVYSTDCICNCIGVFTSFFEKVWWPYATLFEFIFLFDYRYIHTYSNSFIHKHSLRPIAISACIFYCTVYTFQHFLICRLSDSSVSEVTWIESSSPINSL